MRTGKATLIAAIIVGLLIYGCGVEKKEIRLAFKFQTGQKQLYASAVKTSSQIYESGALIKSSDISFKSDVSEEVLSVDKNNEARIRLTDISKKVSINREDSTKLDTIAQSWSIEYLMTPNGKIADIFSQNLSNINITNFYKNYYEQALPVFPEIPVAEGYSWSQTIKLIIKNEKPTKAETFYKIRAFVREAGYDCAIIEYKGNMILPFTGTDKDGNLVVKLEKINSEGVIYFGYSAGVIVSQEENYSVQTEGTKTKDGISTLFNATGKRHNSLKLIKAEI